MSNHSLLIKMLLEKCTTVVHFEDNPKPTTTHKKRKPAKSSKWTKRYSVEELPER